MIERNIMGLNVRLKWTEGLQFTARAGKGPAILTDSSDGASRPSPMELVLMGLAGCTAIDVVLILQKKRLDLKNFEVIVGAEQAEEYPRRFTKINIEYILYGNNIKEKAVEQAIMLSETKYCSAMASMNARFEHNYRIVGDF